MYVTDPPCPNCGHHGVNLTRRLQVAGPAILAGASEGAQRAISRFALALGQAYQLQNDLLDLSQPVHEGSDLVQGKRTIALVRARDPDLQVDGEMHGDSALDEGIRRAALPETTLRGAANLLVLPDLDSANIAYNLLKTAAGNNVAIGPMLLGCAAPVNILTPSATVRRIVNVAALTVANAGLEQLRAESKRKG